MVEKGPGLYQGVVITDKETGDSVPLHELLESVCSKRDSLRDQLGRAGPWAGAYMTSEIRNLVALEVFIEGVYVGAGLKLPPKVSYYGEMTFSNDREPRKPSPVVESKDDPCFLE